MIFVELCYKTVILTLLLFWAQVIKCSLSEEIISDFKTALMYFSEPFLKGAKFDGRPLEGAHAMDMAEKLVQAIDSVQREYPNTVDLDDLVDFKNKLIAGIPFGKIIAMGRFKNDAGEEIEVNPDILQYHAIQVQEYLTKALKDNAGLVIPTGWMGHGLALVIKPSPDNADTIDMAFVNTGSGIEHHYHSEDPNGIYPALSQVWVEFVGVPNDVVFSQNAWFIQGLIALKTDFLEKNLTSALNSDKAKTAVFLYGSFLANFKDYLVEPKPQKLIPMQRSGSCALSSLLGGLLYKSKSEETFYLHQLKIGHVIIANLLEKLGGDSKFKEIIADGFGNNERYFFKGLSSSIAQKTLKYLEAVLPNDFKQAGLIGSERFKWIFDKKAAAIKSLASNEIVYENIKTSVKLSLEILKFLNENKISDSSNEISINQEKRDEFKSYNMDDSYDSYDDGHPCTTESDYVHPDESIYEDQQNNDESEREPDYTMQENNVVFHDDYDSDNEGESNYYNYAIDPEVVEDKPKPFNFYDHLKGDCDNIEEPIRNFDEFYSELKRVSMISLDSKYFYRVMKVFQRVRKQGGLDWWNIFVDGDEGRLLELMEICENIAHEMNAIAPISFDDISLLVHIEKLSWTLALNYDNRMSDDTRIGLEALNSPQTLRSVLYGNGTNISSLAGHLKHWIIHNMFDYYNFEMFMEIVTAVPENDRRERFMGPECFCYSEEQNFKPAFPERNKEIYDKMMEHPKVDAFYKYKISSYNDGHRWQAFSHRFAKFLIIFLHDTSHLRKIFPQYYVLMNTLSALRLAALGKRVGISNPMRYWIYPLPNSPEKAQQNISANTDDQRVINYSHMKLLTETWRNYGSPYEKYKTIFYRSRHTLALTFDMDITNIETWLNYVKSAKTAKLFDSPYFQYITDHILNVPKVKYGGNVIFPIDSIDAEQIIFNLSRLIGVSMRSSVNPVLKNSEEKQTILISRAVNLSIIFTRFIGRIDSLNLLNGKECARHLANIYNLMIPFAKLRSDYDLEEENVTRINLALAFVCTVQMRNSLSFMNMINIETGAKGIRKSLERYHWFVARRSYILKGLGTSIADDQFNYGVSGSPLTADETEFLEELLRVYFLPEIKENPSDLDVFKYHSNGYIVEMSSSSNPLNNVMINLWTGAVVRDGLCLIKRNMFLNSKEFRAFFNPEERILASNGVAVDVGSGKAIYALEDFKGSNYVLKCNLADSVKSVDIYRKWNDAWYEHSSLKNLFCSSFDGIFDCNHTWMTEDSKFYLRVSSGSASDEELLVFPNDSENPVLRLQKNAATNTTMVFIDGLNNDKGWQVLKRGGFKTLNIISLQKHLDNFSDKDYVLAKSETGGLVLICLDLRLTEDCKRPLVLAEKDNNLFEVLNVPNTEVCIDQSISGGLSIPGTLLVTSDSKKSLLLPFITKQSFTEIERIPVLEDKLVPQTVYQKLLLAYYMILAYNFDLAEELLHPYTSIAHNEPFSSNEIEILVSIKSIGIEAPEVLALKLYALIHYDINLQKFPMNNNDSLNFGLQLSFGLNSKMLFIYMLSIREIPEKYYIFRVFPEILSDLTFYRLFERIPNFLHPLLLVDDKVINYDIFFSTNDTNYNPYLIGSMVDGRFFQKLISEKNETTLELMSHFILRRGVKNLHDRQFEMALFCYVKDPATRFKFARLAKSSISRWDNSVQNEFSALIKTCSDKYKGCFEGINQSTRMAMTSLDTLRATMLSDVHKLSIRVRNDDSSHVPESLVTESDIEIFRSSEANLQELIEKGMTTVNDSMNFDDKVLESSQVLRNLNKSIGEFINNFGQNSKTAIDLSESAETTGKLEYLRSTLLERIEGLAQGQEVLIAELAAIIASETHSNVFGSILSSMHRKKSKSFANLYSCYLKDSLACIQRKFPQLTLKQCKNVQIQAKLFYAKQVLIDFFSMLEARLSAFLEEAKKSISISIDELSNFCAELTKISDFNERMEDPVIMNFEYRSRKYRLRKEQSEDVNILTKYDDKKQLFNSVVIQRMMAAGKTLVLGTISVVKKALQRSTLSILVPPSSLYQSNTTAMQNRTYQYFKKKGITFSFPRFDDPAQLERYLKNVTEMLTVTMESNNYLILSPDALSSFLNSYIEFLLISEKDSSAEMKRILVDFARIYRLFKQRGSIILDEIDMTMDPKKELNFPTLETEPYNMTAVALIADIFEFIMFDDDIIREGLKIHSNNQAGLTPDAFIRCKIFILDYIKKELEDLDSIWYKFIMKGLDDQISVDEIMVYLGNSNMAEGRDWIADIHKNDNELIANSIIIIKSQLHHHLETALKGTVNQNYGAAGNLRPEIKFAVPYIAANTPSAASIFADRWETLLKTLLMIGAMPCPTEITKELIDYARTAIISESVGLKPFESTTTYKNLKLILPSGLDPMSLDKNNFKNVEILNSALSSRSPAAIRLLFSFYINQVFDNMTFPAEQISSNALNMTSMFGSIQGYSGTIDNVNILPQMVINDAYIDHEKNEKNNGGISLKLIKDNGSAIVPELRDESFSKTVEGLVYEILNLHRDNIEIISAIIDTGAFFKNFKNGKVAGAILKVLEAIETVLYYDEDSNQLEFVRLERNGMLVRGLLETTDPDDITRVTRTDLKSRFTFYDQRHITGSDILQPKFAHAILTAGPRVLLRDILQGTLRMRQFMTSQKVHFITTESSRNFYGNRINIEKGDLSVSDILALGSLNEDEKQEHENEKLAFVKIDAEIRAFVIDELSRYLIDNMSNEIVDEFVVNSVKHGKALFLRSIRENPLSWLHESKYEETVKVLNVFAISRLHRANRIMKYFESDDPIHQRFNSMKKRIKNMISPEKGKQTDSLLYYTKEAIRTPLSLDIGTEVQQQTLTLTLVDVNMDQLVESMFVNPIAVTHDLKLVEALELQENEVNLISNSEFTTLRELYDSQVQNPVYMPYVKNTLLTEGRNVAVTKDLTYIVKNRAGNASNPIFSKHTMEGTHLLIQVCNSILKVILISQKHASKEMVNMKNYDYNYNKLWICDLSGRITGTNGNDEERGEDIINIIPQCKLMIFDLLVFNGSFDQIIKNDSFKDVYKRIWIKSEYFKERATFLRMRMKILMEKDLEIFEEDDDDVGMLKSYSLGEPDPSNGNGNGQVLTDGYPKKPVNYDFEMILKQKLGLKQSEIEREPSRDKIKFDLNRELELLFGYQVSTGDTSNLVIGLGLQPSLVVDVDLDLSETVTKSPIRRIAIHLPEIYENHRHGSDSKEIFSNDVKSSEIFDIDPITGHELEVDPEMPEFSEQVDHIIDSAYIFDVDFE